MKSSPLLLGLVSLVSLAIAGPIKESTLAKRTTCNCAESWSNWGEVDACGEGYVNSNIFRTSQKCVQADCSFEEYQQQCSWN